MSPVPENYTCIDCGGVAHLLTLLPEDFELEPGYPLAYRCADCMERFDVIWEPED
jgi:DNA-directed RNA polymerase subunit RPC12/RpoP